MDDLLLIFKHVATSDGDRSELVGADRIERGGSPYNNRLLQRCINERDSSSDFYTLRIVTVPVSEEIIV